MTRSHGFWRMAVVTVMLFVVVASAASDQAERVVVISVTGDWKHQESRVRFGQSLPATGCLFAMDGSVVLQPDKTGAAAQPFICEKPSRDASCTGRESARCAVPLDPAKWKSGSGTSGSLGNLWMAVRKLFTGDPEKYMVAASRGLEPELADAVILLDDHKTDLAPVFNKMEAGQYWVTFEPLNGSAAISGVFEVQYVAHRPATALLPTARPGLYRLSLADKAGERAGSDCWILLSLPQKYPRASEAFHVAAGNSSKWPEDMDPSAVRALLRAYLESLSISQAQQQP